MKRLLVMILILVLACNAAAADPAGMYFSIHGGVKGRANIVSYLIPIRSGPGYLYDNVDEDLTYFSDGAELTVCSQVRVDGETWIQAEIASGNGKIRCYMVAASGGDTLVSYAAGSVPWEVNPEDLCSVWACRSYDSLAYRYGPGEQYAYTGTFLSPADNAFVVLTEGDWALVEATNRYDDNVTSGIFSRRGWVRSDELQY